MRHVAGRIGLEVGELRLCLLAIKKIGRCNLIDIFAFLFMILSSTLV